MEHTQTNAREENPAGGAGAPQGPFIPTPQENHHNRAVTAMVLSIIGLALFILPGINLAGLVLCIVGFSMAVKNRRFAAENGLPENTNNRTAYVCGLIGIIINGVILFLIVMGILFFVAVGATAVSVLGPTVQDMLTESAPMIEDFAGDALPAVESLARGLFGIL